MLGLIGLLCFTIRTIVNAPIKPVGYEPPSVNSVPEYSKIVDVEASEPSKTYEYHEPEPIEEPDKTEIAEDPEEPRGRLSGSFRPGSDDVYGDLFTSGTSKLVPENDVKPTAVITSNDTVPRLEVADTVTYEDRGAVEIDDASDEPIKSSSASNEVTANVEDGRTLSLPAGTLVWLSETGNKFHSKNDCGNMNPNTATQVAIEKAAHMPACKKCW